MTGSELISARIEQYLVNFRRYYPGILEWYSGLRGGFSTGHRRMFVSWDGSNVDGLAITKNGVRAKLCHISVSPSARDHGIGSALINNALLDMAYRGAREIRVTTSEEVFYSHGHFFRAAGFTAIDWKVHKYRRNASEILWKMDVDAVIWHYRRYQSCQSPRGREIFDIGLTNVCLPLSNETSPMLFEESISLPQSAQPHILRCGSTPNEPPIIATGLSVRTPAEPRRLKTPAFALAFRRRDSSTHGAML